MAPGGAAVVAPAGWDRRCGGASSGGGSYDAKPAATQAPAEQAPVEKPSVEKASAEKLPAEKPAAVDQVAIAVRISGFAVQPNGIKAHVGDPITFTNRDSAAHTVTATAGASFDSGSLDQGRSFTYTPKKAGTIKFVCDFHPGMTGTISVS
jgi:plastocyanin